MHSQGIKWLQMEDSCFSEAENGFFFMISKMELNHTCGAPCKDRRKHITRVISMKSVILQDVQDQPSLKPKDIRRKCKYDYDIEMNYYYVYTGKQMAMKDIRR